MSIGAQPTIRSSNQPLGANRDQRRRFLLHHLPLALASAVVLPLFMGLPLFNAHAYPQADIVSGTFPLQRREGEATGQGIGETGTMHHEGNQNGVMGHGGSRTGGHGGHAGAMGHGGLGHHGGGNTGARGDAAMSLTGGMHQLTVASGYVALGLLGLTLLIGPANLLLRRRVPVSNYLSRDVGTWTAVFSVGHVISALLMASHHGSGLISSFLHFFVAKDGRPLTNSFGLGNWTGLAALVIVVGLLAISSDFALRKLKAKLWKRLQRLNYALFALVILHAFFYGALLRVTSPFTLLLGLCVIAVCLGQAMGIWLWRRRYAGIPTTVA